MKTCAKLSVSFYQFLGDRFAVPGAQSGCPTSSLQPQHNCSGICSAYGKVTDSRFWAMLYGTAGQRLPRGNPGRFPACRKIVKRAP